MIAYLKGKVLAKTTNYIVLENSGIGYKIFVTPDLLEAKHGELLEIYIHTKTNDDGQTLFGVSDFKSLQFFELLLTVTGVGPKSALGILSSAKIEILENAIANQDTSLFTKMSGVGKKTAERIILELKNKIGLTNLSNASGSGGEIFDALIQLGFSNKEAKDVIQQLDGSLSTDQQLKQALKILRA